MAMVEIETHGCKLNTADSQQIAAEFLRAGFSVRGRGDESSPDVFILNSCTVTHVADKKARQSISAAKRRYPNALTVMTGCYPERDAHETATISSVDLVLGNTSKHQLVKTVAEHLSIEQTPCASGRDVVTPDALLGRTRASVKIQEGCDQVCAYCIVPKVRGRERSVHVREIIEKVQRLEDVGCKEVIFTGTQLGHYGFDLETRIDLRFMLKSVLNATAMPRIRVSSLQPPEIDHELLDVWLDEGAGRLCPHFHMPLQSGSDSVLRRMRRTYTSIEFLTKVDLIRSRIPDAGITTDIITGFPGEADSDHLASKAVMESASFSDAHVFPYSARPGTSAFQFDDQIEPAIKASRARELRAIAMESAMQFRESLIGKTRPVLWERRCRQSGFTDNYVKARIDQEPLPNLEGGVIEDVAIQAIDEKGVAIVTPLITSDR